jgi:tRNA(Ile)-lysidine synthase
MTPALLTLARRALTGEAKVERGQVVLVAVSGGPDSMALLHVLARLAPPLGLVVQAHGVDHGLRAEAARELDVAEAFATRVGVAFGRTVVEVGRGGNLQARARQARYAALAHAARAAGAAAIATAHHADDRAETLLMRLMRGAGPRGLAVLPPRAPLPSEPGLELLRPLLRARRSSVRAHVARHHITFASDPSNADPRFLRARVRLELLPLLEELAPGIVDHLVALADQLGAGDGAPPSAFPLPRATQIALADLVRSRSRTARVWLPGGLVASVDSRARPGPAAPPGSSNDHPSFRPPA